MEYQVVLCHEMQGLTKHRIKHFDLGVFDLEAFRAFAGFLCVASGEGDTETMGIYEGPVNNILQAWGSLDYHCYLLPLDVTQPAMEFKEDFEVVPAEKDPR
jgi:hypothetical protein